MFVYKHGWTDGLCVLIQLVGRASELIIIIILIFLMEKALSLGLLEQLK